MDCLLVTVSPYVHCSSTTNMNGVKTGLMSQQWCTVRGSEQGQQQWAYGDVAQMDNHVCVAPIDLLQHSLCCHGCPVPARSVGGGGLCLYWSRNDLLKEPLFLRLMQT